MSTAQVEVMRPAKLDLVSVSLCCNDPDNGMPTGNVCKIEIGDDILTLDTIYWPPKGPSLKYDFVDDPAYTQPKGFGAAPVSGKIKISRRHFEVWGYKYGWGNWCWDLVLMRDEDVIDLVNYLKELGVFQIESGETQWCNYFEAEGAKFDKDRNTWIRMLGKWGYQRA